MYHGEKTSSYVLYLLKGKKEREKISAHLEIKWISGLAKTSSEKSQGMYDSRLEGSRGERCPVFLAF